MNKAATDAATERLVNDFLTVANKAGIEKIRAKIDRGFVNGRWENASLKGQVERQLRKWVDTNPDGRHRDAISAATDLFEHLFGEQETGERGSAHSPPPPTSDPHSPSILPASYTLQMIGRVARGLGSALRPEERPRFAPSRDRVELEQGVAIVQPGKVPVFLNPRDLLIVLSEDLDHPDLTKKLDSDRFDARYQRAPRMGSTNSEDALTWSVLRSLERRGPRGWLTRAMAKGLERAGNSGVVADLSTDPPIVDFWFKAPSPVGYPHREGQTELDALIRLGASDLISIEAKTESSFSTRTKYNAERHQFERNMDVLLELADKRGGLRAWPTVLIPAEKSDLANEVRRLLADPAGMAERMPHRSLEQVESLCSRAAILTWEDLISEVVPQSDLSTETKRQSTRRRPLTHLHATMNSSDWNAFSCKGLRLKPWSQMYSQEVAAAPNRHARREPKKYFVGHTGVTSSRDATNRIEDHLAVALWNSHGPGRSPLALEDGDALTLLDYQVPLKARLDDRGVGTIDLVGLRDDNRLQVIELKRKASQPESPLKAVAQGLAYCAILEGAWSNTVGEVHDEFGRTVAGAKPELMLMAPDDYWDCFLPRGGEQETWSAFLDLLNALETETGVVVRALSIGAPELALGLNGSRPVLDSPAEARWVAG